MNAGKNSPGWMGELLTAMISYQNHVLQFLGVFLAIYAGTTPPAATAADPPTAPPRFVVIVNDYEKPEFARALLASTYEDFGAVVAIGTGEKQNERVHKQKVKQVIAIPELRTDFLDPSQFADVGRSLADLTSAVVTYPQLRAQLLPIGSEMKTIVDSGSAGLVRRAGVWAKSEMLESEAPATLVLRELSGREYRNAQITGKEPDGLMVRHEGGVSKVLFVNLPKEFQDKYEFDPIEAEKYRVSREVATSTPTSPMVTESPVNASTTSAPAAVPSPASSTTIVENGTSWTPSTIDDVVSCSLFVKVAAKVGAEGEDQAGGGSAFLCNVDGATYIYSNVHNFDGTADFSIIDTSGREYTEFASIEVAAEGEGYFQKLGKGGDVIRLRLPDYHPKALTLAPRPTEDSDIGRTIVITGNTRDRDQITQLTGKITSILPDNIIEHNAKAQAGNSGSPIVDLETFQVIGILTWGAYKDDDPVFNLWSRKSDEEREGLANGPDIVGMKFVPTTLEALYRHRIVFNNFKQNTRLLGLLDTLYPNKAGVFVDTEQIVMGDYTVKHLLDESPDHPVVRELMALDRVLQQKAGSNVGISNQDMFKLYIAAYRSSLGAIEKDCAAIEGAGMPTFFMKCLFEKSQVFEISKTYRDVITHSIGWYDEQRGTRAETWPIAKRIRLPEFRSGIDGLKGIKE